MGMSEGLFQQPVMSQDTRLVFQQLRFVSANSVAFSQSGIQYLCSPL